ncbi:MAG: hypothetical protein HFI68_05440 [Lachnospiraceae bacterium]|nr:hypothetical protein [Lachnospiraceae bacterium]
MELGKWRDKEIIVYGTGYVARKFYKAMEKKGLRRQICCFVRSGHVKEGEVFEGIPVFRFSDVAIGENTFICLAVHEAILGEIEDTVRQRTREYLWVYPYLYEMMFGEPEQKAVEIPVKALLEKFSGDFRLGIRLAAIGQQRGLNDWGFDVYIRAQMIYCGQATAKERLEQFRRLIAGWEEDGYKKDYPLSLNRSFGVIDGNHRLSMAVYAGQKTICGNIYPTDLSIEEIHGYETMQSEELLRQNGFTVQEIQKLEEIQRRYLEVYKDVPAADRKKEPGSQCHCSGL